MLETFGCSDRDTDRQRERERGREIPGSPMHPWGKWMLLPFPWVQLLLHLFLSDQLRCGHASDDLEFSTDTLSNTSIAASHAPPPPHLLSLLIVLSHCSVLAPIFQALICGLSDTVHVCVSVCVPLVPTAFCPGLDMFDDECKCTYSL